MKKQVLLIHGGTIFDTYKEYLLFLKGKKIDLDKYRRKQWSNSLRVKLGGKFDVLLPKMPNPANAKYEEWKILFKKIAPKLKNKVILIGHSLGGIFLAKYLSENKFPKKVLATILISPPFDDKGVEESLGDFKLPRSLKKFEKQSGKVFLYHSKDDKVVPFTHLEKYAKVLPGAVVRKFKGKGHFNQASFPELVRDIKLL